MQLLAEHVRMEDVRVYWRDLLQQYAALQQCALPCNSVPPAGIAASRTGWLMLGRLKFCQSTWAVPRRPVLPDHINYDPGYVPSWQMAMWDWAFWIWPLQTRSNALLSPSQVCKMRTTADGCLLCSSSECVNEAVWAVKIFRLCEGLSVMAGKTIYVTDVNEAICLVAQVPTFQVREREVHELGSNA